MKIDRVYYWTGGTEVGRWCIVMVPDADGQDADQIRAQCRRMGYVAHKGSSEIGQPEGPPTQDEIDRVLPRRPFR